jgi:hypothetical protein
LSFSQHRRGNLSHHEGAAGTTCSRHDGREGLPPVAAAVRNVLHRLHQPVFRPRLWRFLSGPDQVCRVLDLIRRGIASPAPTFANSCRGWVKPRRISLFRRDFDVFTTGIAIVAGGIGRADLDFTTVEGDSAEVEGRYGVNRPGISGVESGKGGSAAGYGWEPSGVRQSNAG